MLNTLLLWNQSPNIMNKRIENKINRWYGKGRGNRIWIAKHYHRWITYGCPECWNDNCSHEIVLDSPKGFGEMAEYCYEIYGDVWKS